MKFVSVGKKNRETFDHLFNLYLHDLSEYSIWVAERQGADGIFLKGTTDRYFNDETMVYLIYYKEHLAGFVCLTTGTRADHKAEYMVSDYFILRAFRKTGFAKRAIRQVFRKYPGKYSLHVIKENIPAHRFWRGVITGMGTRFKFIRCDEERDSYLFEVKKELFED